MGHLWIVTMPEYIMPMFRAANTTKVKVNPYCFRLSLIPPKQPIMMKCGLLARRARNNQKYANISGCESDCCVC